MVRSLWKLSYARKPHSRIVLFLSDPRGATLIETAILLPFLLFLIFFIVWKGVSINEQTALETGLGNALRLGATRGDASLVRSEILPGIHSWVATPPGSPPSLAPPPKIGELLVWPDGNLNWGPASLLLDGKTIEVFTGVSTFQSLPAQYVYVLVYVYQSLRQSIGNSIRYPCDPDSTTQGNGPGCVLCQFMNPIDMGTASGSYTDFPPPTNVIAVRCRYRPALFLFGPLYRLMHIMSGSSGPLPAHILTAQKRFTFNTGEIDG